MKYLRIIWNNFERTTIINLKTKTCYRVWENGLKYKTISLKWSKDLYNRRRIFYN